MNRFDITIDAKHLADIRQLVFAHPGVEGAAYMLFGRSTIEVDPWDRESRVRFTSHAIEAIPKEDEISASDQHITWSTDTFVKLLKYAEAEGLYLGIVHSHPHGPLQFSPQDDSNEAKLVQLARNRGGKLAPLLSILLTTDKEIIGRAWIDSGPPVCSSVVRVIGRNLEFHRRESFASTGDAWARQALAFGPELNQILRRLKIGVVGCGGTGSATAMLLARLGVGQIALFDEDIVESTNLGRLHGARQKDADGMRLKVDVLADEIAGLGLGVRAVAIPRWIGDPKCRDALKSCDVVFGCTDDHDGRMLLNRLAYFYLIPVIDMGLAIEPKKTERRLQDLTGRVTVLTPHAPCLLCRGIVDPEVARAESLRRQAPQEYERQKREAYVRGAGNPAPAVVTFTTATACLAIDELIQALTNFRGEEGWAWQRVRRFDLLTDRRPGAHQSPTCPICTSEEYWGLGDVDPFLDRVN